MTGIPVILALLGPVAAAAEPYQRPIPQAQSATAELWYALASLALIAAFYAVHRLVWRR